MSVWILRSQQMDSWRATVRSTDDYIVKHRGNLHLQNFMTCDLLLYYAPFPLLKYGHLTLFEVLYLHYSTSPICYIKVNVNNDNLTCTAHFGCFLTWES